MSGQRPSGMCRLRLRLDQAGIEGWPAPRFCRVKTRASPRVPRVLTRHPRVPARTELQYLIEPALRKVEIGTPSSGLKHVLKRKTGTLPNCSLYRPSQR